MRSVIVAILTVSSAAYVPDLKISVTNSKQDVPDFVTTKSVLRVAQNLQQTQPTALKKLSANYQQLQKDYYLQMAFLQAAILASGADMATQGMEATSIDFGHVAAMATVASTMSGVANAIWLRQLENTFPGTETPNVFMKTMIHATIIASIINSAYLAFVPLLTAYLYHDGGSVDFSIVFSSWSVEEFITLTKLELLMFIPYNTVAFKFVPPSVRPLTHAAVSATFNVAVSAVTLGYFDRWCEYAMHPWRHHLDFGTTWLLS